MKLTVSVYSEPSIRDARPTRGIDSIGIYIAYTARYNSDIKYYLVLSIMLSNCNI